jgi:hypothetical protein
VGDEQTIINLASQAESQDPVLMSEINRLAARFDHDSILSLIQEARKANEHGNQ